MSWDRIQNDLATAGFSIQHVFPSDDFPGFSYSVGMSVQGLADVILIGAAPASAQQILTQVCLRLQGNEHYSDTQDLVPGVVLVDVLSRHAMLLNLDPTSAGAVALYAMECAEQKGLRGQFWQLVYSDRDNRFPWDHGVDASLLMAQPILSTPVLH